MIYLKNKTTGQIVAFDDQTQEIQEMEVIGIKETAEPMKKNDISRLIGKEKTKGVAVKKKKNGCSECGGKFLSRGLCSKHYAKFRYDEKKKKSSGPCKYECIQCTKEVTYKEPIDIDEVVCPHKNCGGKLIQKF